MDEKITAKVPLQWLENIEKTMKQTTEMKIIYNENRNRKTGKMIKLTEQQKR